MPRKQSKPKAGEHGGPASPDLSFPQKGASYYEGLDVDSPARRKRLAESQDRSRRRIGDESQGPRP